MNSSYLLESFLECMIAERGVSANTVAAYRRDIKQFLGYAAAKKLNPISLERGDVEAFLSSLSKAHMAASTSARKLSSLKQFFTFLYSERLREDNPTSTIETPKKGRSLPKVLSHEEVDRLLKTAQTIEGHEGGRMHVLLEILYASGLRVSELVTLKLSHLERNSDHPSGYNPFLIVKGKGGKERLAPLNDRALSAITDYLKQRPYFLKGNEESSWLFPSSSKDGHISRQRFGQLLKELSVKSGIAPSKLSPHTLRHSFASHLLAGGADLRVIQELLGHADISTTQIYTHIANEHLQELVNTKHPLAHKKLLNNT